MPKPRPILPQSIALGADGAVTIAWRDGRTDTHRARDLRLKCLCARCVHEVTRQPLLDPASVPQDLTAAAQKPIGNYAVQFTWSDGHSTGLYSYALLRELGERR